jgi:predicted nuclease of predicted toxin-antitoxin system
LKFLVDAQLPPSLARWISSRDHEATHVFDVSMHTAGDAAIWEYAAANGCVLLTKDEDFVDRWLLSAAPIALVWNPQGQLLERRADDVARAALVRYGQAHRTRRTSDRVARVTTISLSTVSRMSPRTGSIRGDSKGTEGNRFSAVTDRPSTA